MTLTVVMALAYTVAIPATVGLFTISRKKNDKAVVALSLLFLVALGFELLATLSRVYFHNNLMVLNFASIMEGWILLYLIKTVLIDYIDRKYLSILFPIAPVIFTIAALVDFVIYGSVFFNDSYTVKNACIIGGLMLLFWQVANGMVIYKWMLNTMGAFLFYYLANFIFFLTVSEKMDREVLLFVYDIHNIINATVNLFFGFALWKLSLTKPSLLDSSY